MPVAETSKAQHRKLGDLGELSRQERLVYDVLKTMGDTCRADVAGAMKMEKSTTSARINALIKKGMVVEEEDKRVKSVISGVSGKLIHALKFKETFTF